MKRRTISIWISTIFRQWKSKEIAIGKPFIGVVVSCLATSLSATPVHWSTDIGGNGHYYEFVEDVLDWELAKVSADSRVYAGAHGHLATITSPAELIFLNNNFGVGNNTLTGWLGGYQDRTAPDFVEPDGGWRWVTGEAWDFTNWRQDTNFPDEYQNQQQDFLRAIDPSHSWDDIEINPGGGFINGYYVEYSGTVVSNSADLSGDGDVDDEDLGLFFASFTGPGMGPPPIVAADLTGDGDVDDEDLGQAFSAFTGPLAPINVPEPAALLPFALLVLSTKRRRARP